MNLHELAADDNAAGVRHLLAGPAAPPINELSPWYFASRIDSLSPLHVACLYGSASAAAALLQAGADPNCRSSVSSSTPLHFAAAGAAAGGFDVVKLLLSAGADSSLLDASNRLPADVIAVPFRRQDLRIALHELLGGNGTSGGGGGGGDEYILSPPASPAGIGASQKEKKEWPVDPSLPDINSGAYATDEFRMFSFKVKPCSRAYSHDWTECPFVHPGENARRRDPRKFHYSCVPCPEFRKGACRRGDLCEYAHGVFESWLHPAQYRTRLCKDGAGCARRVCFFAHLPEELRPLCASTGAAASSPRANSGSMGLGFDAGAAGFMPPLSPYTPPLSPSGNGGMNGAAWAPQQNVPALHLPPVTNLQLSRLRTSLSARDVPCEDISPFPELDGRLGSPVSAVGLRSARAKSLMPSNLDELFTSELRISPRYTPTSSEQGAMFSPTHKAALLNQFQQHQSLLSPVNTAGPALYPSEPVSPISSRLLNALAQREKQQQQTLRSLSSRELGAGANLFVGSPVGPQWNKWPQQSGSTGWSVNDEELGRLRRSSSFELRLGAHGEEPDLSWVSSLVKEPTPEKSAGKEGVTNSSSIAGHPSAARTAQPGSDVLAAWLDDM